MTQRFPLLSTGVALILAGAGCTAPGGVGVDTSAGAADDTADDTGAEHTCATSAPSDARLELELYAYGGFHEARRLPGYLRSAVFRSDEELSAWLVDMEATHVLEWSFNWDEEVAVVGYLDTLEGRPTEFGIVNLQGVGSEELTSRWCVVWPTSTFDQDSRVLAVYAIASGSYTTLHETLRWDNQEEHE